MAWVAFWCLSRSCSLTANEAARYLHEEYKRKNFRYSFLEDTEELQKWLEQDVDGQGREIVDVEGR